jgi:hypothetical protein
VCFFSRFFFKGVYNDRNVIKDFGKFYKTMVVNRDKVMSSLEQDQIINQSVNAFTSVMNDAAGDMSKAFSHAAAMQQALNETLSASSSSSFSSFSSSSSQYPMNQVRLDVNAFFMVLMTHPVTKVCFKTG